MKKQAKNADLIAQVLRLNDFDPTLITRGWRENIEIGGIDGVIAVVVLGRSHAYAVINVPVLVFSSRQAPIPVGAALQLMLCLPDKPTTCALGQGFLSATVRSLTSHLFDNSLPTALS